MRKVVVVLALGLLVLALWAGTSGGSDPVHRLKTEVHVRNMVAEWNLNRRARKILRDMTLEDKIGALFVVRPEDLGETTTPGDNLATNYRRYPVSGFIFFGENLLNPSQTREYIESIQQLPATPLLIAVDQEGGKVSRFNSEFDMPQLPSMYDVGLSQEPGRAFDGLRQIGTNLKALGFNLDFAPVADIWSNPANTVIGDRAFAETAQEVAPFVEQAVLGLEQSAVASCLKHFPGHGDTLADSHDAAAISDVDAKTLRQRELIPFMAGIEAGSPMVMVAHIKLPGITHDDLPASLSHVVICDLLRDELGFDGVVITDALDMGAISEFLDSGEASCMAIEAGADLLLMPKDLPQAFAGVKSAVKAGKITENRIEESVLRILKMRLVYR